MDGHRFDAMTRRLAAGVSRRSAVKGAAAGLLAAVGLERSGAAQVSQARCGNRTCANRPEVCDDGCVCCAYQNARGRVTNSRCRPPGTCGPGTAVCPPDRPIVDPVAGCVAAASPPDGDGSLDDSDPTLPPGGCFAGFRYDLVTFEHGGGVLSLGVRGESSGGGTLTDPYVLLVAGAALPPGDPCAAALTDRDVDDDAGCGADSFLQTTLDAGTYTAVVLEFGNAPGTYTVELNPAAGGGDESCP